MDPTGITTKASQITKIYNRMYYMPVNYGDRLDIFLRGIESNCGTVRASKEEMAK